MASKFYAVISGAGTGTGRAAALRFAKTYSVVLMARTPASYETVVAEIQESGGHAIGISADAGDASALATAFGTIKKELPDAKLAAAIYNVAAGFSVKSFLEQTVEEYDASMQGNARGFFNFAKLTVPELLEAVGQAPHPPTLIATGATASVKGSAKFGTFAAGMHARRALSASLAREFGPQGVHVAHAIIDGGIDVPRSRHYTMNNGVEDGKLNADAIADSYWHLHTQHRSAFTWELDMRPYVEKW